MIDHLSKIKEYQKKTPYNKIKTIWAITPGIDRFTDINIVPVFRGGSSDHSSIKLFGFFTDNHDISREDFMFKVDEYMKMFTEADRDLVYQGGGLCSMEFFQDWVLPSLKQLPIDPSCNTYEPDDWESTNPENDEFFPVTGLWTRILMPFFTKK